MRLDSFLSTVGIVKRRTEAARWLRDGRVLVDGHPAKPAHDVRPGQRIRVEGGARGPAEWIVHEIPAGNVPKAHYSRYAERVDAASPGPGGA